MRVPFFKSKSHQPPTEQTGAAVEKYDSHAYAVVIAFGLPLMAIVVPDFTMKLWIACIWFAVVPVLYFWIEGMEIVHQILKYGVLDQQRSDQQRRTMIDLYYGVIAAFVLWLLSYVAYVASHGSDYSGFWSMVSFAFRSLPDAPLHYGVVEWGILLQTLVVARFAIHVYYALLTAFLQATAGQKRYETETRAPPPQ